MESDSDSDDSQIDRSQLLSAMQGLSAETYAALFKFQNKSQLDDDSDDDDQPVITDKTVFATYTPNDMSVIAATIKRLQTSGDESAAKTEQVMQARVLQPLQTTLPVDSLEVVKQLGIVRLDNILTSELCDECLASINKELSWEIANAGAVMPDSRFGNVLSREFRWDMYLPYADIYKKCLVHMLGNKESPLGSLFNELFHNTNATFHEFSSLISDPGASSQPIHPDTQYQDRCPLYTVFVALQDVEFDMGPTIFMPSTANQDCHTRFKNSTTKDSFLLEREYRQGVLRKGDVAMMDSRTMHCGDANWKARRVLMYFTIKNPHFPDSNPPKGSLMEGLEISTDMIHNDYSSFAQ